MPSLFHAFDSSHLFDEIVQALFPLIDTIEKNNNGLMKKAGELVEFEEGTIGIAPNLESNNVGVVLIDDGLLILQGSFIKETGRIA